MSKIGIVVPVLNQFEKAIDCLVSIQTFHEWFPVVVPNYRLGWSVSKSWNYGIKTSIDKGAQKIIVCNDDVLFHQFTIESMAGFLDRHSECVLVTANNLRDEGLDPEQFREKSPNFTVESFDEHPDFSLFMVNNDIFEKVGLFDENFEKAYFEDNDYHRRINLLGYHAYKYYAAWMYHYGSQTQNADEKNPVVAPHEFVKNREYYFEKWGCSPLGLGTETYEVPYNDLSLTPRDWR